MKNEIITNIFKELEMGVPVIKAVTGIIDASSFYRKINSDKDLKKHFEDIKQNLKKNGPTVKEKQRIYNKTRYQKVKRKKEIELYLRLKKKYENNIK
ncbi:MAG: hypothetical protein LBH46_01970 [Rickettsiales bacterium]|jgi:hypothetical protein|nr:hypothetical protein [Rickettsiales bacterium]